MTEERRLTPDEEDRLTAAEAQELGAAYAANGGPVPVAGRPHTAQRIMFVHGAMRGHASCDCPVVDEHGQNVNPGRTPLEGRAAGRAEGSRKASETYARRRARKAADELAVIDATLWDDETRRIVTTLATLCAASRVDDVLADEMPVTDEKLERIVARLGLGCGRHGMIRDPHCGTCVAEAADQRYHRAAAAEAADRNAAEASRKCGLTLDQPCELPLDDPRHELGCPREPVHDNGDYRA